MDFPACRDTGTGWLKGLPPRSRLCSCLHLAPLLAPGLAGCSTGVLDPHGPIGSAERVILLDSLAIMLVVVVPTILATVAFAWWFRSSNTRARYLPDWAYSGRLEFIVWAIPALVVMFLGGIAWIGSHDLDPFMPIESKATTLEVEVVSLDWKWLFIYPDKGVASVNELTIPVNTPVHFRLTSGTVMNSFFVPQLGSQIYTMAGMTSQLYLLADAPGDYRGISAMFSGDGFSDMHFQVHAVSDADFAAWMAQVQAGGGTLDQAAYKTLVLPAVETAPHTYGAVESWMFETIEMLTTGNSHAMPSSTGSS
ncbi:MAG TPA: ubiquinol oxidase subunit II [Nevskia sp.]|nr:ubiquinol oxidase subunit II [Nevskia sp.]